MIPANRDLHGKRMLNSVGGTESTPGVFWKA